MMEFSQVELLDSRSEEGIIFKTQDISQHESKHLDNDSSPVRKGFLLLFDTVAVLIDQHA